jgi:CRP-like cAMP-binding protein
MVHFQPADCVACLPEALARVIEADPVLAARWRSLPQRRLKAGETLLRIGEPPQHVWWIRQGLLRCYFLSPDGLERNKSFRSEGAWVGSGMPPRSTPSPYAIEALEATELLELSYTSLADVIGRFPMVETVHADALGWVFSEQVAREAELLSEDAASRYARFLRERPALAARLPLHHLASHLGITNVALSRIRRRMGLTRA